MNNILERIFGPYSHVDQLSYRKVVSFLNGVPPENGIPNIERIMITERYYYENDLAKTEQIYFEMDHTNRNWKKIAKRTMTDMNGIPLSNKQIINTKILHNLECYR
jgi:hypothetical protein